MKVKFEHRPSSPSGQRVSPVSVAWSDQDQEYLCSRLDGMLVHRRVVPSINCADIHFCTWVGRGTVRVLSCPRTSHSVPSQGRTRTARTTVTQSNDEITYILYIRRSPYDSVKYLFNLIPLRKDNLRPDCSKLQLSKMAALPLSENEARIIIKRAKW